MAVAVVVNGACLPTQSVVVVVVVVAVVVVVVAVVVEQKSRVCDKTQKRKSRMRQDHFKNKAKACNGAVPTAMSTEVPSKP